MTGKTIPSLTDKAWASENELGTIEEVIEYHCGEKKNKVKAVAHVLSGEELEAIEAKFTISNYETGEVDIDGEGFNRAKWLRIFRIDEATLDAIFKNKSSDLRTKMAVLANRACGYTLDDEGVQHEKNSESPVASHTT